MRTATRATLWTLLALAVAAPAAAQRGLPALPLGQPVRVTLSAADPTLSEWGSYRAWRFNARPDHVYQFTASADSARVGLRVVRVSGVLTEYVASSAREGGVNRAGRSLWEEGPASALAGLRFRAAEPGAYLLVLTSPDTAAVTLRADEIALRPPLPRSIAPGSWVRDTLNAGSGVTFDSAGDERAYDLYNLAARASQRLDVVASGASVRLGRLRDGAFVELPFTQTTGVGGVLTVPADGEYAIQVSAPPGDEPGVPYALWLSDDASRPVPGRLEPGRAQEARFDPAVARPAEGELVDQWVMQATAGEALQISARSSLFDTYLMLGRVRDGVWEQLEANDDSGETTDSRILHTVQESGEYVVRVRPFSTVPDSAVPYTLLVEPHRASVSIAPQSARRARPETRAVRWGTEMTGRLDETDAGAEDGSAYDAWTFSATAGQRIVITLHSEAFDSYLAVGRDEGGEWMELTSNDDVQPGTLDARVVMVAPDTGTYVIRVNTFPAQPAGPYTLRVQRER